jgi:hypothetical protein
LVGEEWLESVCWPYLYQLVSVCIMYEDWRPLFFLQNTHYYDVIWLISHWVCVKNQGEFPPFFIHLILERFYMGLKILRLIIIEWIIIVNFDMIFFYDIYFDTSRIRLFFKRWATIGQTPARVRTWFSKICVKCKLIRFSSKLKRI